MFQTLLNLQRPSIPADAKEITQPKIEQITATELHRRLQAEDPMILLDVRFPDEFAAGHIAGAHLLPLPALAQGSSQLPQDQPVVCICRSGNRSQVACEQLARLGFENLVNLHGGMIAWTQANLPAQF